MHRHTLSATSLRKKVSFDLGDLTDDSDPEDYRDDNTPDWTLRAALTAIPPRKARRYVLTSVVLLVFLYVLFRRSQPPRGVSPYLNYDAIDWSRYAYTQYVADEAYLCNSVMVFEALDRLGSRADRIMFYPQTWDTKVSNKNDRTSQLLNLARDRYKVQLEPITVESVHEYHPSGTMLFSFLLAVCFFISPYLPFSSSPPRQYLNAKDKSDSKSLCRGL
jgi:hypothetical protein